MKIPYRPILMTPRVSAAGVHISSLGAKLAAASIRRVIVPWSSLFWDGYNEDPAEFTSTSKALWKHGVTLVPGIWSFDSTCNAAGIRNDGTPGQLCLLGSDEIEDRLNRLASLYGDAQKGDEREIAWDSELYFATPGMNGGKMGAAAWPLSEGLFTRARWFGALHKTLGFRPSTYVTTEHASVLGSWSLWWRATFAEVTLGTVYAEDTYCKRVLSKDAFSSGMFRRVRGLVSGTAQTRDLYATVAVYPGYWPVAMSWKHVCDGVTKGSPYNQESDPAIFAQRLSTFAGASFVRVGHQKAKFVKELPLRTVWYYDQSGEILDRLELIAKAHKKLGVEQ